MMTLLLDRGVALHSVVDEVHGWLLVYLVYPV